MSDERRRGAEGRGRDVGARRHLRPDDLADHGLREGERIRPACSAIGTSFVVTIGAVIVVPRGMSWAATTIFAVVGAVGVAGPEVPLPLSVMTMRTNAIGGQEQADEQDEPVAPLQGSFSLVPCDRRHHCSIVRGRRDYTKGP